MSIGANVYDAEKDQLFMVKKHRAMYSKSEVDELEMACEEGIDSGRREGFTKGRKIGYERGYRAGKEDGLNEGYQDGIVEGIKDGRESYRLEVEAKTEDDE